MSNTITMLERVTMDSLTGFPFEGFDAVIEEALRRKGFSFPDKETLVKFMESGLITAEKRPDTNEIEFRVDKMLFFVYAPKITKYKLGPGKYDVYGEMTIGYFI